MKPKEYITQVSRYIEEVTQGTGRKTGRLEHLAVQRHLADLETQVTKGIYFDQKAALKAFSFFQLLKHSKGEFSGQDFVLSPWQAFIIYSIFGWKRADGSRRFRYAYVEVARKNGKTTFAAALALLFMIFDGEAGAEVYTAATMRDQSRICWTEAKNMITTSPALCRYVKAYQRVLVMESTISKMEPLASDSGKLDGLNPSMAVCDELHAWKTDDLFNVLATATGSRRQPLIFSITTAGLNKSYPCFSMRKVYIEILEGIKTQENTFVMIFTLDQGDNWKDPQNWPKANPNMNISLNETYLNEEYEAAINHGGRKEVNFKIKNLNIWTDAPDVWIKDDLIQAADHGNNYKDLAKYECYAGLDLAAHIDINALALLWPNVKGRAVAKLFYWIPQAKVEEQADIVNYQQWEKEGHIFTTPGEVIDIDQISADISDILTQFKPKKVAIDPAKAYHGVIQNLQKAGHDEIIAEYQQGIRYMSEPAKLLEKMLYGGEIDLLQDPVLRWMFRNVVIYRDSNGNIKPDKKRSQNKIDGVIALINALAASQSSQQSTIYNNKPLRVINI